MSAGPAAESEDRVRLQRRAIRLEYATIAWNLGEAVFTISLGVAAGSLALIGFGWRPDHVAIRAIKNANVTFRCGPW